jgi:hypothetical protein
MHNQIYLLCFAICCSTASAFSIQPTTTSTRNLIGNSKIQGNSALSAADNTEPAGLEKSKVAEDDDEDDWVMEEYENLNESDFYNSEWKVGTLMDGSNNIKETWTRLIVQDGEFICVWGDGDNGKWNFDAASQFLSMSKETFGGWLGKKIWAGTVDDYYFVEGSVRGWGPISPASVIGQWQAKRLGVDKDEAGIAPWFEEDEEEEEMAPELAASVEEKTPELTASAVEETPKEASKEKKEA